MDDMFIVGKTFGYTVLEGLTEEGRKQKKLVIPEGVTVILWDAFRDSEATEIVLPDSLASIPPKLFQGMKGLEKAVIGKRIELIKHDVFNNCSSLKEVMIPRSVRYISYHAFKSCTSIEKITIPDNLTGFNCRAFSRCASLREINIPEGVTELPRYVFNECRSLEKIILPGSLERIGEGAFYDCSGLKTIVIPSGVTEIQKDAFCGCTGLTEVIVNQKESGLLADSGIHGLCRIRWLKTEKALLDSLDDSAYNLFVIENEDYASGVFSLAKSVLLEYSDGKLAEKIKPLDPEARKILENMPCIFASRNENFLHAGKDQKAFIGKIDDVIIQGNSLKFRFTTLLSPFSQEIMNDHLCLFGLKGNTCRNQLDTEHWAVIGTDLKTALRITGLTEP